MCCLSLNLNVNFGRFLFTAAFLTVINFEYPFKQAAELLQHPEIKFGCKSGGKLKFSSELYQMHSIGYLR